MQLQLCLSLLKTKIKIISCLNWKHSYRSSQQVLNTSVHKRFFFCSATFGNRFRKTLFPEFWPFSSYQMFYCVIKDSKASSGVSFGFNEHRETYFQSIKISWSLIVVYLKRQQLEKETVTGQNQINNIQKTNKIRKVLQLFEVLLYLNSENYCTNPSEVHLIWFTCHYQKNIDL